MPAPTSFALLATQPPGQQQKLPSPIGPRSARDKSFMKLPEEGATTTPVCEFSLASPWLRANAEKGPGNRVDEDAETTAPSTSQPTSPWSSETSGYSSLNWASEARELGSESPWSAPPPRPELLDLHADQVFGPPPGLTRAAEFCPTEQPFMVPPGLESMQHIKNQIAAPPGLMTNDMFPLPIPNRIPYTDFPLAVAQMVQYRQRAGPVPPVEEALWRGGAAAPNEAIMAMRNKHALDISQAGAPPALVDSIRSLLDDAEVHVAGVPRHLSEILWCVGDETEDPALTHFNNCAMTPFQSCAEFSRWLFQQPRGAILPWAVLVVNWQGAKPCLAAIAAACTGVTSRLRPDKQRCDLPPVTGLVQQRDGTFHGVKVAVKAVVVKTSKELKTSQAKSLMQVLPSDSEISVHLCDATTNLNTVMAAVIADSQGTSQCTIDADGNRIVS